VQQSCPLTADDFVNLPLLIRFYKPFADISTELEEKKSSMNLGLSFRLVDKICYVHLNPETYATRVGQGWVVKDRWKMTRHTPDGEVLEEPVWLIPLVEKMREDWFSQYDTTSAGGIAELPSSMKIAAFLDPRNAFYVWLPTPEHDMLSTAVKEGLRAVVVRKRQAVDRAATGGKEGLGGAAEQPAAYTSC